jgi:D-3-phosphoglycerate dehydrogenase / 2-oxoglutarate reductase
MKKILISDSFDAEGLEILKKNPAFEVVYSPGLSEEQMCAAVVDADALIIRSASNVTEKVIAAASKLSVIARAGVGTDNIDKKAAAAKGILVMNAPGGNSVSTAELAFGYMFALARCLPQANASMQAGVWEKKKFAKGARIAGKTAAVIGLGRIGANLARRCKACDMEVLGYDPFLNDEQISKMGVKPAALETIWKTADFISVHVPLTPETKAMIGAKEIAMMKPTTRLINCARGGIMDEQAVAGAVKEGKLAGAAFDVYTEEPPKNSPLVGVENIILTPHLGASTVEAQIETAVETAEEVADFLLNGTVKNAVVTLSK